MLMKDKYFNEFEDLYDTALHDLEADEFREFQIKMIEYIQEEMKREE